MDLVIFGLNAKISGVTGGYCFSLPWAILLKPRPRIWFWLGIFSVCCVGHQRELLQPLLHDHHAFLGDAVRAGNRCGVFCTFPGGRGGFSGSATCLMTIAVMILVLRPDAFWMFMSRQKFVEKKTEGFPFIDALVVAGQVVQRSSPADFVYVVGSEPEIPFYARRFSPTRFITSYALMDPTPLRSSYQSEAINDLQQHPPKLIVFVQSGYSWTRQAETPPEFLDFLGKFLKQDYRLAGGYVKNRRCKTVIGRKH